MLDEAVKEYITAITTFRKAEENLRTELKRLNFSDDLIARFIEELRGAPTPISTSSTKPTPKPKPRPQRKKWPDVQKGEVKVANGRFIFWENNTLRKAKTIRVLRYNRMMLYVSLSSKCYNKMILQDGTVQRGSPSVMPDSLAISSIRGAIRALETNDDDSTVEVYPEAIQAALPLLKSPLKEALQELLESWKAKRGIS